jgi:hypothetical protein
MSLIGGLKGNNQFVRRIIITNKLHFDYRRVVQGFFLILGLLTIFSFDPTNLEIKKIDPALVKEKRELRNSNLILAVKSEFPNLHPCADEDKLHAILIRNTPQAITELEALSIKLKLWQIIQDNRYNLNLRVEVYAIKSEWFLTSKCELVNYESKIFQPEAIF